MSEAEEQVVMGGQHVFEDELLDLWERLSEEQRLAEENRLAEAAARQANDAMLGPAPNTPEELLGPAPNTPKEL